MEFQVQKVFQTKPDKKVPTHGPGTSAFYRGKACKVLSIANGKAKIFVDGRILIVNYTSLDDQMYGKMSEGFRVVNEKTHKSLFTGSQDECNNYVKENELEEDEDIKVIKLKESFVSIPRNGQTFQQVVDKHPRLVLDPLFYGVAVLCRKWEMLDKSDANAWFKENDKLRKNYVTRLKIADGKATFEFLAKKNSNVVTAIFYSSPESAEQWFVPADGKLNESEAQEKYQAFFKQKLSDYGVSSPAELSAEDKSKFFAEIKKEWPEAKLEESVNESSAFGIGSTAILNGEQCKVVSIANGECKIVCDGIVKKCNMSELKPIVPMNEAVNKDVEALSKVYNKLSPSDKERCLLNVFGLTTGAEKIVKKYPNIEDIVKAGTKAIVPGWSKVTALGLVKVLADYCKTSDKTLKKDLELWKTKGTLKNLQAAFDVKSL